MQAAVEAQVEKAVKAANEAAEAKMRKMQSTYESKYRRLERQAQEASQQRRRQAAELMDAGEPEEAARILAEELKATEAGATDAQMRAEAADWVRQLAENLGQDVEDEATAERLMAHVETLVNNPGYETAFDVQQQIAREHAEAQAKEIKELARVKDQIPDLVEQAVARRFAGETAPELTQPGAPSKKNPIKDITSPTVLLTRGLAKIQQQGGGS
jgi:hypothetical protein